MSLSFGKSKRNLFFILLVSTLLVVSAFSVVYFTYNEKLKRGYEESTRIMQETLIANTRTVYASMVEIKAGDLISPDNVALIETYSEIDQDNFITSADLGKIALIDIPLSMDITRNMVSSNNITSSLREVEFSSIRLNSNTKDNDFVDVRLTFPNGEDYTVLSKKQLKSVSVNEDNSYMWLSEEEILFISSAIIDSYLIKGSRLYVVKYLQPTVQEASIVNYVPSQDAITLTAISPNVVESLSSDQKFKREELEARISLFLGVENIFGDVSSVQWSSGDKILVPDSGVIDFSSESEVPVAPTVSDTTNTIDETSGSSADDFFVDEQGVD